jgi:hypothetical protein
MSNLSSLAVAILCAYVAYDLFKIENRTTLMTILAWLNLIMSAMNFTLAL